MDQVNLTALARHESVLRQQAHLAVVQSRQTADRLQQLSTVLFQNVVIVSASMFSKSLRHLSNAKDRFRLLAFVRSYGV